MSITHWGRIVTAFSILGVLAACGGAGEQGTSSSSASGSQATAGSDSPEAAPAAAVKAAIREHIRSEGDALTLPDPTTGEEVRMTFDYVHESVAETPGGRQSACVDFRGEDGTVYDVDFYVDLDESGTLQVEDVVMHMRGDENVIPDDVRTALESGE